MQSIVIAEKPSQARNILAAVGTRYGEVLPAQGHLLRLQLPEEENPDWKSWGTDVLRPANGRYRLATSSGGGKPERLRAIRDALKTATRVIIATDADREGQAIGQSLLEFFNFKGEVLRAMFTAEDETTLKQAFANARPNSDYHHLYDAAVARQQGDQIFNLSLTRAATVNLVPRGVRAVIGIGRVRTPTLAIVCKREIELATFSQQTYFDIAATVTAGNGTAVLTYKPKDEERIFEREAAQALADGINGWQGPVSIKKETKHQSPPRPMDLPSLQRIAAKWGWPAKKTLDTAQALYETHKISTYPRASTRYLPENMEGPATEAFRGLVDAGLAGTGAWDTPTIRKGKAGTFSDKALAGESHHAIIPNPAVAAKFAGLAAALDPDERKLFDVIMNAFLACLGPDHVYDRTELSIEAEANGLPIVLKASGSITRQAGWKALSGATDDDEADDDDKTTGLPDWQDGEAGTVETCALLAKTTAPPPRYDEGSLIQAMQNAWKFVDDPDERERLKLAKGIGTAATRDTIIDGLKAQNLLTLTKGKLFANEPALQLYRLLSARCPELIDAGATARLEADLDLVATGETGCQTIIDALAEKAGALIAMLNDGKGGQLAIKRPPSPAMIDAARRKAAKEGGKVPAEALKDFDACRQYLGPMPERADGDRGPSPAQIELAEKIAARTGATLTGADRTDPKKLSAFIDANNLASPRQKEWIEKLVAEGKIKKPKGFPDRIAAADAKPILDKAFAKPAKGAKR